MREKMSSMDKERYGRLVSFQKQSSIFQKENKINSKDYKKKT